MLNPRLHFSGGKISLPKAISLPEGLSPVSVDLNISFTKDRASLFFVKQLNDPTIRRPARRRAGVAAYQLAVVRASCLRGTMERGSD